MGKNISRYLKEYVEKDLNEKMVFLGGPRQVGKTTLSLGLLGLKADETHPAYLNWDSSKSRALLKAEELPANQELVILDEIHKAPKWRSLVKGLYDTNKSKRKFLVTGSARIDAFRKGGDSLQGRYHYYRLHPFSPYELSSNPTNSDIQYLLKWGGFPEPFTKGSEVSWGRWQNERQKRLIYEDIVSVESLRQLSNMELLLSILPSKVGSILSVNSIRQDLGCAFETAEHWISILENLYHCFRLSPYGYSKLRTAKKEKKLFMWDWSIVENEGAKFENFVASQLLKYCHFIEDTQGRHLDLHFLRDSYSREIDFIVAEKGKVLFAVECKVGEKEISENIKYFSTRMNIPKFYQVHMGKKHTENAKYSTEVIPIAEFCKFLGV